MALGGKIVVYSKNLNATGGAWSAKWHPERMTETLDASVGSKIMARRRSSKRTRRGVRTRLRSARLVLGM